MTRCLTYPLKVLGVAALWLSCVPGFGQVTGLVFDLVETHEEGELSGYATYRLYAVTEHPGDFISTVGGDAEAPFILSSTGTIWQSATGGNTGSETISFPGNEWDSWFTIGSEPGGQDNAPISTVGLTTAFNAFNSGQGFEISNVSGGAWFITYPCNAGPCSDETPGFAGVDRRVLLGQLTANGILEVQLNALVFPEGDQTQATYMSGFTASTDVDFQGCPLAGACNFSPSESGQEAMCDFTSCLDSSAVSWELLELHTEGPLEGMATVRIYAQHPDVSLVGGDLLHPFELESEGVFNVAGSNGIFPDLLSTEELGPFDTWAAIGEPSVGCILTPAQSPGQPFESFFLTNGATSLTMNDVTGGGWFHTGSCNVEGDQTLILQCTFEGFLAGVVSYASTSDGQVQWSSGTLDLHLGCTDTDAANFNPNATVDDNSCVYGVGGCNQPTACNFDATADHNDGSCTFPEVGFDCTGACVEDLDMDGVCDAFEVEGCTQPEAVNYEPNATEDDGSCLVPGCRYPAAVNFNPLANVDDGTCQYEGCTNVNSVNFNPLASVDDGSCEILGCMEFAALNFDPTATLPGACAFCVGDLNFDGFVSLTDLFGLLEVFGTLCQ